MKIMLYIIDTIYFSDIAVDGNVRGDLIFSVLFVFACTKKLNYERV